jgi:hypothetical protein
MTCKLNRILVIVIGLLGMPAFASTIKKMDLVELVSVSDAIAQGTVESVESRWEKQSIYTYTSIRVDEAIKGGPRRALLIRQAGGQIGALHAHVPGMPQFKAGDQVIVFLHDRKDGTFDVVGLGQGKYDIVGNNAVTNTAGMSLADPKTGALIEAGPADQKPLEAFKARIRGLAR